MILKNKLQKGFTLVEMAIVLVIFGLLLSALFLPLQAQQQQAARGQTITTTENAKTAILGYAQSHGRLPCPATAVSNGMEAPLTGGTCNQQVGFLPAATLGIQPTDAQGFALDAWNNRIRYAVTSANANTYSFTTTNAMNTLGMSALTPDLRVCASSLAANCSATINLTSNAVAVIFSTGATGSLVAGSADETENLNAVGANQIDTVFVSRDISQVTAPNEFDHLVTWISPYTLYNAMIQAGQLH
jgi:prepilin-type N-terminal cleavage/methylation domain-containing protein